MASALVSCLIFFLGIALKTKQNVLKVAESFDKDEVDWWESWLIKKLIYKKVVWLES